MSVFLEWLGDAWLREGGRSPEPRTGCVGSLGHLAMAPLPPSRAKLCLPVPAGPWSLFMHAVQDWEWGLESSLFVGQVPK